MSKTCAYCNLNTASNSEHVFPYSLGGENIFMDCVCDQCNNFFSGFERELLQKSMISLLRSSEGVEGYSKNKTRSATLKYPEIFQYVPADKTVYEVGIHEGFKPFIRPQVIQINNSFYTEAPSKPELTMFIVEFTKWRKDSLTMIVQFPTKPDKIYKALKYQKSENSLEPKEIDIKLDKKAIIHYILTKENEEYYDFFEPRLFMDDNKKLIVRSRSIEEGKEFMKALLNFWKAGQPIRSFSNEKTNEAIRVSMKFNIVKMQQALVKISLNSLMYYYPETQSDILLNAAKGYVLNGTPLKIGLAQKIDFMDTNPKCHTIFFSQIEEGLVVRTGLFNGSFVFTMLIDELRLFNKNGLGSVVEINFKTRKQTHLPLAQFLAKKFGT